MQREIYERLSPTDTRMKECTYQIPFLLLSQWSRSVSPQSLMSRYSSVSVHLFFTEPPCFKMDSGWGGGGGLGVEGRELGTKKKKKKTQTREKRGSPIVSAPLNAYRFSTSTSLEPIAIIVRAIDATLIPCILSLYDHPRGKSVEKNLGEKKRRKKKK